MTLVVPPGQNILDVAVYNAQMPREGPKVCGVLVDFSLSSTYQLNTLLTESGQYMSMIQGVFVDNSTNNAQIDITVDVVNITYKLQANSQGYIPLLCPKNARIAIKDHSSASTAKVPLYFYNSPIPAMVWGTTTNTALA